MAKYQYTVYECTTRIIQELKTSAIQCWGELQRIFQFIQCSRNKAELYLAFRFIGGILIIFHIGGSLIDSRNNRSVSSYKK
eukprot:3462531-Ditylum_brightwellii.AAC.1